MAYLNRRISYTFSGMALALSLATVPAFALTAQDGKPTAPAQPKSEATPKKPQAIVREGSMTVATMREIINRIDKNAREPRPGQFLLVVNDFQVAVFTGDAANRMRVMVRVKSAENLTKKELIRISQANLDSALDARYAIGRGVLWATYIHPLSNLYPRQLLEGIGSTVNLAATYGQTYTSGQTIFGGGDSRAIIGRKLIDQLIKKGEPI